MAGHAAAVPEDVVEYRIYPEIPEGYEEQECEKYLEDVRNTCLAYLSQYIVDFIWQSEPFRLRVVAAHSGFGPPHLYGKTHYGDNVEDEWFIVYLLHQLTQRFTGYVAKVCDTDGEFLLIEAANNLPKWLNPLSAENRVYIYNGKLNVIPLPEHPGQITPLPAGTPQISHGVRCIREYPHLTTAPDAIQRDIQFRMAGFPEKLYQSRHRAHCYIPAPLAAVLDRDPALVAPMVQAFYHRDPLDLKGCVIMKHFRPGTRVMREVKFTRCLYAQLMQQRFNPDKRGGWNVPAPNNPKFKSYDLGMKLAHGAEILCSQCGNFSPAHKSRILELDTRWQKFKSKLSEKGYFKGEIEGSKLYSKLEEDARTYFQNCVLTDSFSGPESGRRILTVLANAVYDIEDMRKEEKDLSSPDDDSWLELSPEQLDDMLNKAASHDPKADSFNLSNMADSMKAFVEKISSHEGAEFPKGSEEGDIQFDPSSFIQTMQKMFEFEDSASDSSTDMSEYGSDDELDNTQSPRKVTVKPVPPPRNKKDAKPNKGSSKQSQAENHEGEDDYLGMQDYMRHMDKELAKTTVGQSFEKAQPEKKARPSRPPPPRPGGPQKRPTAAPPPPPRKTAPRATLDDDLDIDDEEDEDFEPVDIDLNMVKNLLESYNAQDGLAGPTSNVLGSMGIKIPKNEEE